MAQNLAAEKALRRTHRKSRRGCKQCKQRHQKCDEQRPSCVNCTTTGRQCSFRAEVLSAQTASILQQGLNLDLSTSTFTSISYITRSTLTKSADSACENVIRAAAFKNQDRDTSTQKSDLTYQVQIPQVFELDHLVLLHNLDKNVNKAFSHCTSAKEEEISALADMVFESAVASPYLMDELLALSALHLSTSQLDAAKKQHYQRQAQQLQTRALMHFNAAPQIVDSTNCTSMFLFSSFLGMHLLFDATSIRHDFIKCLDKFDYFLRLHRGVRSITQQGWNIISQTEIKKIIDSIETVDRLRPEFSGTNHVCALLERFLKSSADTIGPTSLRACLEAVTSLNWVLAQYSTLPKPYPTHVVLAWSILIPAEYTDLLKQRRPEALVILAHWAVLMYYERDFWLFNDSGKYLIESISKYLGAYWDPWMVWPKEILGNT